MNHKSITTCPICKGDKISKYATCQDYFTSGEIFDLYQCEACQFILTQSPPLPSKIGEYYKSNTYISHSNTNKGFINKVYHAVRSYMLIKKAKLIEKYSPRDRGTLLDVGAGIGLFIDTLRKRGWSTEGIEPSPIARKYALDTLKIELQEESFWDQLQNQSKDIITLWHVLEHIPNLHDLLDQINRVLTQDGTLIIAVPNCKSYDASVYKQDWAAYDVPRHLWHFEPKTITELAQQHQLELIAIHTMPFDGFYISMTSEKNKQSKAPLIKGFSVGLVGWIKSIFKKDASSSLIYVFKKKQR